MECGTVVMDCSVYDMWDLFHSPTEQRSLIQTLSSIKRLKAPTERVYKKGLSVYAASSLSLLREFNTRRSYPRTLLMLLRLRPIPSFHHRRYSVAAQLTTPTTPPPSQPQPLLKTALFIPPGVAAEDVSMEMVIPGSNIVLGPYAGEAKVKTVEFVKSSAKAKDCPRDPLRRPEFAVLGRSNVGKSSLINALARKKDVALTSKKPGKTQLINHFLINKSWYLVDLPGYGFAHASQSAKTDWTTFTKGYFLNRDSLVSALLLVDSSVPPQQIDLDCANWLGRNNISFTFVFTKCDKAKGGKGKRPDDNLKKFQDLISRQYQEPPPWIMTSSVNGLGRDNLLLHMSQLRNYWDQEGAV